MMIMGVDYHPSFQTIAFLIEETGEYVAGELLFAFVLLTKSGAPGGIRTPDLLVRSQWSQNAKCPIWRRLRTGNAILPSISCTQSCTQNRVISNLYRTRHKFNP
jgi:hypothetical protein